MAFDWFNHQVPHVAQHAPRWDLVRRVYSGDYADPTLPVAPLHQARSATATASAFPTGYDRAYLIKRQTENTSRFNFRVAIADPSLDYPRLMGALSGQIVALAPKAKRTWGEASEGGEVSAPWGTPDDEGTPAYALAHDADGAGTDYEVFWATAATDLIVDEERWFCLHSTDDRGHAFFESLPPGAVPNYTTDAYGRVTSAVVRTERTERAGVMDEPVTVQVATVYTTDGYERYERRDEAEPALVMEDTYRFVDRSGLPCLPIIRVKLPMPEGAAWLLAKKALALYNMENRRDTGAHLCADPRLVKKQEGRGDQTQNEIKASSNYHVIGVDEDLNYITPNPEGVRLISESILPEKREALYEAAWQRYADQARQATATEITQEQQAGPGAFLALVTKSLDEAENNLLYLWAQAQAPVTDGQRSGSAAVWGALGVERSSDFAPMSREGFVAMLRDTAFGTAPVPLGEAGEVQAALAIARQANLKVDKDEVQADVQRRRLTTQSVDDLFNEINNLTE